LNFRRKKERKTKRNKGWIITMYKFPANKPLMLATEITNASINAGVALTLRSNTCKIQAFMHETVFFLQKFDVSCSLGGMRLHYFGIGFANNKYITPIYEYIQTYK
jgi:hypothetical protein